MTTNVQPRAPKKYESTASRMTLSETAFKTFLFRREFEATDVLDLLEWEKILRFLFKNYVEKNIDTTKLSTTEWTLLIEILKMLLL